MKRDATWYKKKGWTTIDGCAYPPGWPRPGMCAEVFDEVTYDIARQRAQAESERREAERRASEERINRMKREMLRALEQPLALSQFGAGMMPKPTRWERLLIWLHLREPAPPPMPPSKPGQTLRFRRYIPRNEVNQ